jgi:predicted nuclease of predicted toxin-antitoxin system
MKFLIDAQPPRCLAHQLRAAGLETTHKLDLPEGNRTTDQALITLSLTQHCVVVTKDSDFVETFLLRHEPLEVVACIHGQH